MKKTLMAILAGISLLTGGIAHAVPWNEDEVVFADGDTTFQPSTYENVSLKFDGMAAGNGDCVAVFRDGSVFCGYGEVFRSSLDIVLYAAKDTPLTLKIWRKGTSDSALLAPSTITLSGNQASQLQAPNPGSTVSGLVLTVATAPMTCTVSFKANGGNGTMANQTMTKGVATKLSKCTFTKAGYTFKQWSGSDGKTYSDQQSVMLSDNLTLTAQWTATAVATKRTVTFNANGGTVSPTTRDVDSGSAVGTLPTATKTGYTLKGWYTSSSGGTQVTSSTKVTGDVTYYAQWTANTYMVTFNANGGSVSTSSKSVTYDSTYGTLPTPTRTGTGYTYSFDGWYTSSIGGNKITSSSKVAITSAQTLYAHWTANMPDDGREMVQLWEGGPYWATTNIGAEKPEDYGWYFWWGDTVGYRREWDAWVATDGSSSNFPFNSSNPPTYGKDDAALRRDGWITADGVLAPEHDAAHVKWGGDWRMPTYQEQRDLSNNCDWTWTTKNGVNGCEVRGRGAYSSNIIFLPCDYSGKSGACWSSVPCPRSSINYSSGYLYTSGFLGFTFGSHGVDYGAYRYDIFSIRPVQGFTARTTVTVMFNANGGAVSQTIRGVGSGSAVGTLPTATKAGYTLKGWYTLPSDGIQITSSTKVTENITYYAQWIAIDPLTLQINTEPEYITDYDGTFSFALEQLVKSGSKPKLTLKGLPSGLKYDAKTMMISGKATKPGVYVVTVSATSATVKKAVTKTFKLTVPNLRCKALPNLDPATDAYGTSTVGVAFDSSLVDCWAEDGYKVSVSGLPTGLKWDAKVGTIVGVPTKAGTYTVTFTATKGREKQIATITLSVEALPDWAQGTFYGYFCGDGYPDDVPGLATMTVSSNGRISGKFFCDGTNYTFGASSFNSWDTDHLGDDYLYATVIAKAGRESFEMDFTFYPCEGMISENDVKLVNASVGLSGGPGYGSGYLLRNMWKDKTTANAAKKILAGLDGMYTMRLEGGIGCGYLSLTVGKDGNVKATGKLPDGTAVSVSAPIVTEFGGPGVYLGKNGAFWLFLDLQSKLDVGGDGYWKYKQWTIESGYECVGDLHAYGAFYDKSKKLGDYCEGLLFVNEDEPELHGTCKYTYLNENNRKVSYSELLWVRSNNPLTPEVSMTVDRNGKIIVPKATKPLQDKESGEWRYDGENDGALTLSFSQTTGIFKGTYTMWFDYESAVDETTDRVTWTHTSKKINFEGIVVQGADYFSGFYLWDAVGVHSTWDEYKTYKYKQSKRVDFAVEKR